jgi:hypothetical protein
MAISETKLPPAPKDQKSMRTTAGVNVIISIAAATALLVVVNVISASYNYRKDVETLGRYSLSESAARILSTINQPVRLTSIYTSTATDKKPEKYLPHLRDLMDEMRHRNENITVVNVSSDRQKAEVLARLRERLDATAKRHRELITAFQDQASPLAGQLEAIGGAWANYPTDGWLSQLGLAVTIKEQISDATDELKSTNAEITKELAGVNLPNYPSMTRRILTTLQGLQAGLDNVTKSLKIVALLPEYAGKAKPELMKSAEGVTAAVKRAADALNADAAATAPTTTSSPADASAGPLGNFVKELRAAGAACDATSRAMDAFAKSNRGAAAHFSAWRAGDPVQAYAGMGEELTKAAQQADDIRIREKPEYQQDYIKKVRPELPTLLKAVRQEEAAVGELIDQIAKVDPETQKIFDECKKEGYLKPQIDAVAKLLKDATELPELADQNDLIAQINQDNIVLIEVGDKTGVATFEEVWPLKSARDNVNPAEEKDGPARIFYGDMAISSKLLSLTTGALAEVVITTFERTPPPQQQPGMPQVTPIYGPLPSIYLETLKKRLEKANFKVTEWNLLAPDRRMGDPDAPPPGVPPPPKAEPGRPQVLLILPPPTPSMEMRMMYMNRGQPGPKFTKLQEMAVTNLIAQGTPAIFLTAFLGVAPALPVDEMTSSYRYGEYLQQQWGLNVRTDRRLVMGDRDPTDPGKFELPILHWSYMPLSSFTDNPIGKPLKARRMIWFNVCPIELVAASKAATVDDILIVPQGVTNVWASASADKLQEDLFTGKARGIAPDPNPPANDLLAPMAVAVQAQKKIEGKDVSIVVLGMGMSFIDQYLSQGVPRIVGGKRIDTEDPPTADADVVVNSVYHLIGKDEYIGAGPTLVEPIDIAPPAMVIVKAALGIMYPLVFLATGIAVMLMRRR